MTKFTPSLPEHHPATALDSATLSERVNDPKFLAEVDLHTLGILNAAVAFGHIHLDPANAEIAAERYSSEYLRAVDKAASSRQASNAFAQTRDLNTNIQDHAWLMRVLDGSEGLDPVTRDELEASIDIILAEALHQWTHVRKQAHSISNFVRTGKGLSLSARLAGVGAAVAYGTSMVSPDSIPTSVGAGAAAAAAWMVLNPEKIHEVISLVSDAAGPGRERLADYASHGFEHAASAERAAERSIDDGSPRPVSLRSIRINQMIRATSKSEQASARTRA